MIRTSRQLKALVRNMSKGDSTKAQIIIRKYVMERFLERLSLSAYSDNLILKGGILVTALVGLDNRSTMDIDATIKNFSLSEESARKVVEDITGISIDDGMTFEIKNVASIMDEADYPGVRVVLDTMLETMRTPLKIDFSSGDIITPHEVAHSFKLLFEDRSIAILTYNLETVLAEKLETLIARGTANTRLRDFYDILALESIQSHNIDAEVLKMAFCNTSRKRASSAVIESMDLILDEIEFSTNMMALWKNYQRKFDYAAGISWEEVMQAVRRLCGAVK
jgi:predicted nucleotidyltransferase component of viral defense system